jgi:hypothetical protein
MNKTKSLLIIIVVLSLAIMFVPSVFATHILGTNTTGLNSNSILEYTIIGTVYNLTISNPVNFTKIRGYWADAPSRGINFSVALYDYSTWQLLGNSIFDSGTATPSGAWCVSNVNITVMTSKNIFVCTQWAHQPYPNTAFMLYYDAGNTSYSAYLKNNSAGLWPSVLSPSYAGLVKYSLQADYEDLPSSNLQVTSTPINGSISLDGGSVENLPQNYTVVNGVHTITATSEIELNASIRYSFQGWSINGSSSLDASNPLIANFTGNTSLEAIYTVLVISDYSSTITFGIGLFGFILIGLSWVVGYHFYKEGDYRSMFFWGFLMLIFGYSLIWVIFGG